MNIEGKCAEKPNKTALSVELNHVLFQVTSPMSMEDLENFALRPAPRDVTIQCRVTRDRRGMEKGIYPTYYLHMEKEDGKRVNIFPRKDLSQKNVKSQNE